MRCHVVWAVMLYDVLPLFASESGDDADRFVAELLQLSAIEFAKRIDAAARQMQMLAQSVVCVEVIEFVDGIPAGKKVFQ